MSKTIQQLAQEAIDVQNACNLSGVLHSFARVVGDLREHGITEQNHPIIVLWADKVASLTATQTLGDDRVMNAYNVVYDLAGR